MLSKENLLNNLHKIYREDKWIQELFNATGLTLDEVEQEIKSLNDQYWFDTITWSIPRYEALLKIKTNPSNNIEDRRSSIEAKWKSEGKCDIDLIQSVVNSWKNGSIKVEFIDGKIQLKFNGIYGVPVDLDGLKKSIEEVKSCHLPIIYAFAYLLIDDIHNKMLIEELGKQSIDSFAFNTIV